MYASIYVFQNYTIDNKTEFKTKLRKINFVKSQVVFDLKL